MNPSRDFRVLEYERMLFEEGDIISNTLLQITKGKERDAFDRRCDRCVFLGRVRLEFFTQIVVFKFEHAAIGLVQLEALLSIVA